MRIGIARIAQETNTFSPMLTGMESLRVHGITRGQEVLKCAGEWSVIPGFLDIVGDEELLGATSVYARPAGCLTEEVMCAVLEWFSEDLEETLPLNELLLDMHGALAGTADPDVEGRFLQRARSIVGENVLIGVVMDLHANITQSKIENDDVLRGYHTHPHVDGRETAQRVAVDAARSLAGRGERR